MNPATPLSAEASAKAEPATPVRSFLSILDLSRDDLHRLVDLAAQLKSDRPLGPRAPTAGALAGSHVALLFEKPSLRTRSTFEVAIRELGGHVLDVPAQFGDGVREPLQDVARNLERWVRALVIRTFAHERVAVMASAAPDLHVINALSDQEHPCQALADMLTIRERWGHCHGRTIAYVGDGNNTATSLVHAAPQLGVSVNLASPAGYELPDRAIEDGRRGARDGATVRTFRDPREAVKGADAVYTDVWTSMGQENEIEQRRSVFGTYQVDAALMAAAAPGALFMHCLPAHRGEEVAADVIESPASVVFDQAENRLHTQKALLLLLLGAPSGAPYDSWGGLRFVGRAFTARRVKWRREALAPALRSRRSSKSRALP